MSAKLNLTGHDHDLGGGFIVRRLLPSAAKQGVGPFLFFDHFGPIQITPGKGNNVRPHPHIGLSTVSYLFDGSIMHRDSLGSEQAIEPGAINWMTAGRGIVHSEREPETMRGTSYGLHGIQLWAALPIAQEEIGPSFVHTPAAAIPSVQVDDAQIRVLIGSAFGVTSPVATYGETLYLDIQLPANGVLNLPALAPEMAVYAVDAPLQVDGNDLAVHALAVLDGATRIQATSAARCMIIGGAPLESHRYMWWNFVSSRKERIEQAAADWEAQRMGKIEGDSEFIPLPPFKKIN
jgi:redox-sensitive bicupin YhaK (pirin superfamily)